MCEPVTATAAAAAAVGGTAASTTFLGLSAATWAGVSTAATVGGTLLSAMSAQQQGRSQQQALNMQAEAAMRDANNADISARRESERGDRDAQAVGQRQASIRAKQEASFAARGVDITYGSAAGVIDQTDYYGLEDQMTSNRNATDADYAQRDRADQLRKTGSYNAGAASRINPWMQAGGTLLAGAGKVSEKWYSYAKT